MADGDKKQRDLLPPLWRRFKNQLDDRNALPEPSAANITLDDLVKLAAEREASNPSFNPQPLPPNGKVSGWIGTPDPEKFAPGTNALSPTDLASEVKKGNVILLEDAVKTLSELEEWEKKAVMEALVADYATNRMFVTLEDGSRVSFGDLSNYVYNNPELKALAERNINLTAQEESSDAVGIRIAPDLYDSRSTGQWPSVDLEAAQQMHWGIVAKGKIYNRRPNRWLWGTGGDVAASFAIYAHEDMAHALLGPKYAHVDPRVLLGDEEYARDLIRAGPMMGMTFMITTEKDLPLFAATDAWAGRMIKRLQAQAQSLPPAPQPSSSTIDGDEEELDSYDQSILSLIRACSFIARPDVMNERTKLLNPIDNTIKAGSTLIVSTDPQNRVILRGMAPGASHKERESYLLGAVADRGLTQALVEDFIGPDPVDPDMIDDVKMGIMLFANGFKADNTNNHPHATRAGEQGSTFRVEAASCDLYRLPRVGSADQSPPPLLSGVREMVVSNVIGDLYQKAWDAGLATLLASEAKKGNSSGIVPTTLDDESRRAWSQAAREALIRGARDLPPEASGVKDEVFRALDLGDLFTASSPLDSCVDDEHEDQDGFLQGLLTKPSEQNIPSRKARFVTQ